MACLTVGRHDVTTDPHRATARDDRPDVVRKTPAGTIALLPSTSRRDGWVMMVDGDSQSYVDVADPTYLHLTYAKGLARILDVALADRADARVVHVGGALMALPRYLAHRFPGSSHVVIEPSEELLRLVDEYVPLPDGAPIDVWPRFGEEAIVDLEPESVDAVVLDAFVHGSTIPLGLTGGAFVSSVHRALRNDGFYVANIIDWRGMGISSAMAGLTATRIGPTVRFAPPGLVDGELDGATVLLVSSPSGFDAVTMAGSVAVDTPFRPVD